MTECEKWLANILTGQVFINCEKIRIEADERDFSKGQLSIARKNLGVTAANDALLHEGKAENWFWLIPRESKE